MGISAEVVIRPTLGTPGHLVVTRCGRSTAARALGSWRKRPQRAAASLASWWPRQGVEQTGHPRRARSGSKLARRRHRPAAPARIRVLLRQVRVLAWRQGTGGADRRFLTPLFVSLHQRAFGTFPAVRTSADLSCGVSPRWPGCGSRRAMYRLRQRIRRLEVHPASVAVHHPRHPRPDRRRSVGLQGRVMPTPTAATVPPSGTEPGDGTVGSCLLVVSACGPLVVRCVATCAVRPCGIRTCVPPSVGVWVRT